MKQRKQRKIHCADHMKDAKSIKDCELEGMRSHKHGLTAKYNFKMVALKVGFWASFKTNFSRVCLLVEGRGSRVTSRGSRVNGRGSRVTSRGSKNSSQLSLNIGKSKFRGY